MEIFRISSQVTQRELLHGGDIGGTSMYEFYNKVYLSKASVTEPVSIEKLGAIPVITMILTSDVTSAGFLFFFCIYQMSETMQRSNWKKKKNNPTSPISQNSA